MKFIVLLFLLTGCGAKAIYSKGDCIRLYSSWTEVDLYILEITKNKYVLSEVWIVNEVPVLLDNKYTLDFSALDYENSQKINCSEVE